MTAHGFPTSHISTSVSPYDLVADYFRGATGTMKDLYRNKDKLLELLDKAAIFLTKQTINWSPSASGHPVVFFPIHWAPDAFMSQKQFETFWWPSFRKLMISLIDAGIIPDAAVGGRLHQAAGSDPRYSAGQMHLLVRAHRHGEGVRGAGRRRRLARQYLALAADHRQRRDEVDAAVRHLAENVFHKGGKLILDAAFGLPDETPVENVRAMYRAARKYGS